MKVWKDMYPNAAPELLDYFYAYMSSGVIGVLENWVCSEYKLPTQKVGKILMGVTMQGLSFLEATDTDKETPV